MNLMRYGLLFSLASANFSQYKQSQDKKLRDTDSFNIFTRLSLKIFTCKTQVNYITYLQYTSSKPVSGKVILIGLHACVFRVNAAELLEAG